MRNLHQLDRYRRKDRPLLDDEAIAGMFEVPSPTDGKPLRVMATSGEGWDHISVSRRNRCPNWTEMELIAGLFFKEDEIAMQLHVPASEHVNNHPYCLHWWRPHNIEIPRPDARMVGFKDLGVLSAENVVSAVSANVGKN